MIFSPFTKKKCVGHLVKLFFWKTHATFDLIPNLASAPVVEIKFSPAAGLLYSREVSRSSFDCRIWWWLQKNNSIILVKRVEIILSAHWERTFFNFNVVGKSLFFGRIFLPQILFITWISSSVWPNFCLYTIFLLYLRHLPLFWQPK